MQTIVITGATGQLGSELRDILAADPTKTCFFLDRKQLPLEQTMIIQDILGMYQPDMIIHAGAYTAVDRAEKEAALADAINHLASEEIAQYCRLQGCKLIAISTDYVFDGSVPEPLTEEAPVSPINTYGLTKLRGEQAIQKWCPEAIIIRTSWVYSTYGNNFVKTMLRLMEERDEIAVVADQQGVPTYAADLAEAIVAIIDSKQWIPGLYHYANAGQTTWYDFAVAIRDSRQLDCLIKPISTEAYPTPAKRPAYSLLDSSKIKAIYDVEIPEWQKSLARMLRISIK